MTDVRQGRSRARGRLLGLAAAACGLALVAALALRGNESQASMPQALPAQTLRSAAEQAVFFGHQSVGMNLLDAVPGQFEQAGVPVPVIEEAALPAGQGIYHAFIGANGDPVGKIDDFAALLRAGAADSADAALMKLCYVDITAGTDVAAVFAHYRQTMAALAAQYPAVRFVHATVPLTAEPAGLDAVKDRVKGVLGKQAYAAQDNAARQRYNDLIRAEYPDSLFDLARTESTLPDGTRVTSDGAEALAASYTTDGGHLNPAGSARVAQELLRVLAADQ